MRQGIFSGWFAKRLACLVAAAMVFAGVLSAILTHAVTNSASPAWVSPSAMAILRVSQMASAQSVPNAFNNLDCSLATYRYVADSTMQTGCFTETAFGLIDSDSDTVIFNGTDEGLPLLPHTPHQILAPWPKAMDLIALDPVSTGGSLISLYKNPLAAVQDQRNLLGQLTAKQLTTAPDITLHDEAGKPLVINSQTIAFSDGGSWLIVETLGGSFVRINLATLSVTAFAPAFGSQGSPALLKSYVSVSDDGQYVAIANDTAASFRVYDLNTCDSIVNGSQPQTCQSYDYRPFAEQQISGLHSIRHIRFVNNGLLSFETLNNDSANNGTYELAPVPTITALTDYIGLGDSYTSGEGAFDYLSDTDSTNNMCHLSRNSYPLLLTHDLFSAIGGHSVACSGATINDVGSASTSYRGQVRGVVSWQELQQSQPLLLEAIETNFVPGYIAQQRFVKRWQPQVATVSVGGDDVGFGDLVQNCVEPHVSPHLSDSTCYDTYEDRLELMNLVDKTIPRWTALYKQLQREAPAMQLYVVGYPQILADTGNCALNVHLNKSELEFAASLTDYLNQDIRKAAAAANVQYVDISQALAGHRLCETASYNVAVNGLTAGKDGGPLDIRIFGKESYRPNALGQSLIEQAILKQTNNLASIPLNNTGPGSGAELLNAPKTGRPINTKVSASGLTTGAVKRGETIALQVSGPQDGLKPNTTYTVRLDGSAGTVLTTVISDNQGDIQAGVTIPVSTTPGGHTIDITGENQTGQPVDVTQPIYVSSSETDSDGDGIEDALDSCPGATNSNHDSDQDGVDDACDNLIGTATAPPSAPTSPGNLGTETIAAHLTLQKPAISYPLIKNATPINTAITKPPQLETALSSNKTKLPTRWPELKIIHWLRWLVLLMILGLLLLLIEKYTQRHEIGLQ